MRAFAVVPSVLAHYHHIFSRRLLWVYFSLDLIRMRQAFKSVRSNVLTGERLLRDSLCFNVEIAHPHDYLKHIIRTNFRCVHCA